MGGKLTAHSTPIEIAFFYGQKEMRKIIDLTGRQFGRLFVLSVSGKDKANHTIWLCKCSCGTKTNVQSSHLLTNHTRSCGCLLQETKTKHGLCGKNGNKLYSAWKAMIARCYNEKTESYHNYGGRGIAVCDRWIDNPANFINDMGLPSNKSLTLERIDVNGNYDPSNCKWASMKEQQRNKRNNTVIEFNGESLCFSEWCEKLGFKKSTLKNRLTVRGWSIEKSLTTPVRKKLPSSIRI